MACGLITLVVFQTMLTCSLAPHYMSESWVERGCQYIPYVNVIPILRSLAIILLGTILLVNARSFPLVWHIKVLLPWGILRCQYHILSFRHMLSLRPSATRHETVVAKLESLCPVGVDPFEFTAVCRSWASFDETDWFGHVNNSTYAKARDAALSKYGLAAWPTFVNGGGSIALSSTHYRFLREIPRFMEYEMSLSIGAWDHKWLYLVCRFTSMSPKSDGTPSSSGKSRDVIDPAKPTMASELESNRSSDDDATSTASGSSLQMESDKMVLHCFTVSRICFKVGRITVPPAIVMACEGFSNPPVVGSYSHKSPPPHWIHACALRNVAGSLSAYRRFLAGGWKDIPEEGRWWVEPLSGPIEERRRSNLARLEAIDRDVADCMDI